MERKSVEKYVRTSERDVKFIEEAIKKGARPSLEEWHDFSFKSEVTAFKSDTLAKYEVVYPKASGMARIEALILEYIVTVQLACFTDSKAHRMVKKLIKQYNKLRPLSDRLDFFSKDADGVVTFTVDTSDMGNSVERNITSRDSLCYFLQDLWGLMVQDIRIFNTEIRTFMVEHLDNEIKIICAGRKPAPYFGFMKCNTLETVLFERTDYENARKAPLTPVNTDKPELKLKVANGSPASSK